MPRMRRSLIVEAKANTHLTHLEELVLTQGREGYKLARAFLEELLETLKGNTESKVSTSVKWDGAPAIFAGINPDNGKFFVGTKSVQNKKDPLINYTVEDIIKNHSKAKKDGDGNYERDEEGNVDHGGLVDKLLRALEELPKLGIKNILQGDFMFDDTMLSTVNIDGEPHYQFTPNTITYTVPIDSKLGSEIGRSKFGIVFHTTYGGVDEKGRPTDVSYGADVSNLNRPPGIWFDDAFFDDDTGTVTLTTDEESAVRSLIKQADAVNNKIDYNGLPSDFLNIYINNEIRQGQFLENPKESYEGFLGWYQSRIEKKIDSLKTEKGRMRAFNQGEEIIKQFESKKGDILNLFKVSRLLFEAKNIFIAKYNNAVYNTRHFLDDGSGDLVATNPEGYVAVDAHGNGVKFVDRLEFSRANFLMDKGFKKDVNESQILEVFWGGSGYSVKMSLKEWSQNLPKVANKNQKLYENLLGGTPITALVREASEVKNALAEAVNWALKEEMGQNIALYPGKFKPPHGGHFNVAKSVLENPGVDKIIIFVSPKTHEGISAEQAVRIWNLYSKYLPGEVDIRVSDITPVRSVYEYIDDEAAVGENLHLILGEKDIEGGRFKTAAGRREGVNVAEVPIPPQMGGVSATQMRKALVDNDDKTFIAGLPDELNDVDVDDIMRVLGDELDEISAAGGVGGVSSSGIAGYSLPLGAKPRYPDVVGSEKKKRKKDEFLKEELVNEVMDYLLGITVG